VRNPRRSSSGGEHAAVTGLAQERVVDVLSLLPDDGRIVIPPMVCYSTSVAVKSDVGPLKAAEVG